MSARSGWVLGDVPCSPAAPGPCSVVARTRDGGASWSGLPAPPAPVRGIRFADERRGFAFGPGLWSTGDGGRSWSPVRGFDGVRVLEAAKGNVWLVVDSDVFVGRLGSAAFHPVMGFESVPYADRTQLSVHGGTAFTTTIQGARSYLLWSSGTGTRRLILPCRQDYQPFVVARSEVELLLLCAAGEGAGGQEPKSAFRIDLRRMTTVRLADPAQLTNEYLAQTADAWFVSNHDSLEVSRDGGRTWVGSLRSECGGVGAVGFESRQLGFVLADLDCGRVGLHLTHDDGRTWHAVDFRRTAAG